MSDYKKGSPSVFHAETVGRGGKVMGTFEVLIEREASLTPSLSEIESRRLKAITVLIHPGFEDVRVVRLDRQDAARLASILNDAVLATAGDEEGR